MMLDTAIPEGSARAALRGRTSAAHEGIDAAFARFDLGDARSYGQFLEAHGRVLPTLEALLATSEALPAWRPRLALLAEDLAALGAEGPREPQNLPAMGAPALHGVLYVLEGSRLGGKLLARGVGEGLPSAFLSAGHEKGEWRNLLEQLDAAAAANGAAWLDEAVAGAQFAFRLYGKAAA